MIKKISLLLLIGFTSLTQAQEFYSSRENSFYWKNRKPFEGYWQQDVHYKIKAAIDEKTDIIDAEEELTQKDWTYFQAYNTHLP